VAFEVNTSPSRAVVRRIAQDVIRFLTSALQDEIAGIPAMALMLGSGT
jgi:hypothetical protein